MYDRCLRYLQMTEDELKTWLYSLQAKYKVVTQERIDLKEDAKQVDQTDLNKLNVTDDEEKGN